MIWLTWRQFRVQTLVTVAAVAVFGVLLLLDARSIADMYAEVASCQSNCDGAIDSFLTQVRSSRSDILYHAATVIAYGLPALIGIFWGAPLIARELETGTHRLAWNQSVTRTRWLATKLAIIGAIVAATALVVSWSVTAWAHHIDSASANRITPLVYGSRGIVPVGYSLFAFALGVACGMLIRRTVPAMAATLAGYGALAAGMPLWIRSHLVAPTHEVVPLDLSEMDEISIHPDGTMRVIGSGVTNAWTLANQTITSSGQVFTGPADPNACGMNGTPQACERWLTSLNLREDLSYHPDSHFWSLQWIETGILLGLAALLIGFTFWWLRRRVT